MIIFTADQHLTLRRASTSPSFLRERFLKYTEALSDSLAHTIIIGGDLFDKSPTIEELELYFNLVNRLVGKTTYYYAGNHEATSVGQSFLPLLRLPTTAINPNFHIITEIKDLAIGRIVPYEFIQSYKSNGDKRPLFTHVRGNIPPHVHAEIDLSNLSSHSVVFAGDLHDHTLSQENIVYSGSPYNTNAVNSDVVKGWIEIVDGKHQFVPQNFGTFYAKNPTAGVEDTLLEQLPNVQDEKIYATLEEELIEYSGIAAPTVLSYIRKV